MSDETAIATIQPNLSPAEFKKHQNTLIKFVKSQLREAKNIRDGDNGDYGIIPGTKKMSLLKPGAEKLLKLCGFTAKMELVNEIEDFTDRKLVMYKYRCTITHAASGTFIADAVRSCNNKEKKHAFKDVYDVANTIEGVAQKRALVAATVQATMASEIFDADVSENDEEAPNRSVTQEEDSRRTQILNRLYGAANRRSLDNIWIHKAIKKRFDKLSLTELSNNQIEELNDLIIQHYEEVEKGDPPKRIGAAAPVSENKNTDTPPETIVKPDIPDDGAIIEGEVLTEEVEEEVMDKIAETPPEPPKPVMAEEPEEEKPTELFDTDSLPFGEVTTEERLPCFYTRCNKGTEGGRAPRLPEQMFCSYDGAEPCSLLYEKNGNEEPKTDQGAVTA